MKAKKKVKARVVAVDMGYGHLRAAYNLCHLCVDEIISINSYRGIPKKDKKVWDMQRKFYEFVSRFKKVPYLGELVFREFDKFQSIEHYYPFRDLSQVSIQLQQTLRLIRKNGWGQDFINKINSRRPLINTFFASAYMAEEFGYRGDIYLVICDADISRAWASDKTHASRIKYLVPTERAGKRLQMYGAPQQNIFLTGFPLPQENTGSLRLTILKKDLGIRLANLDPTRKYLKTYDSSLRKHLDGYIRYRSNRPLTIMFAVGGAGAQREVGVAIVNSLKQNILDGKVKVVLVAGIHNDVSKYFRQRLRQMGIYNEIGRGVEIIYAPNKPQYFTAFNKALHQVDILWTKPSELSFYIGLGIPIIMTEPIGAQEVCNRGWLEHIGAGLRQKDVRYTKEWLYDWLNEGYLAEAAVEGFLQAPNLGSYKIEEIIGGNKLKVVSCK